jgi:hypothetical protein
MVGDHEFPLSSSSISVHPSRTKMHLILKYHGMVKYKIAGHFWKLLEGQNFRKLFGDSYKHPLGYVVGTCMPGIVILWMLGY